MSAPRRHIVLTGVALVLIMALGACVAGGGYEGGDVDYGPGYIEPAGYVYGGWGGGYFVGPSRGGERRGASYASHAYRPAPASRATPSIPGGSRSPRGRH